MDDPDLESIAETMDPWLRGDLAALLLASLEYEPMDEQQEEFRRSIPAHWYQRAVTVVHEHKAWYPIGYDWLTGTAARFDIRPAEQP